MPKILPKVFLNGKVLRNFCREGVGGAKGKEREPVKISLQWEWLRNFGTVIYNIHFKLFPFCSGISQTPLIYSFAIHWTFALPLRFWLNICQLHNFLIILHLILHLSKIPLNIQQIQLRKQALFCLSSWHLDHASERVNSSLSHPLVWISILYLFSTL